MVDYKNVGEGTHYRFDSTEAFEAECKRLAPSLGLITALFVGLDRARREKLKDYAWRLMNEWRDEQNGDKGDEIKN